MKCHVALGGVPWQSIDDAIQHEGSAGSTGCGKCDLACSLPRPKHCTHRCRLPCHDGDCPPCEKTLQFPCHCGTLKLTFGCVEYGGFSASDLVDKLSCRDRCPKDLPCGHRCPEKCHTGSCAPATACKKRVAVHCECGRLKQEYVCGATHVKNIPVVVCNAECERIIKETEAAADAATAAKEEKTVVANSGSSKARTGAKLEGKARRQQRREERAAAAGNKQDTPPWDTPAVRAAIAGLLAVLFAWLLFAE